MGRHPSGDYGDTLPDPETAGLNHACHTPTPSQAPLRHSPPMHHESSRDRRFSLSPGGTDRPVSGLAAAAAACHIGERSTLGCRCRRSACPRQSRRSGYRRRLQHWAYGAGLACRMRAITETVKVRDITSLEMRNHARRHAERCISQCLVDRLTQKHREAAYQILYAGGERIRSYSCLSSRQV